MNQRRSFLRMAGAAVIPVTAVSLSSAAKADDGDAGSLLGTWSTIHSLPFPPGSFRELLTFDSGGGLKETNSFLHTASNLNLGPGLTSLNASDGMGNWERQAHNLYRVVFRKLLFNGAQGNIGDLHVTGTVHLTGATLFGNWQIDVVDTSGRLLTTFGTATSQGNRLS